MPMTLAFWVAEALVDIGVGEVTAGIAADFLVNVGIATPLAFSASLIGSFDDRD